MNLNQHDFWSALGITQSGGSRYENGLRLPIAVAALMELVYVKKINLERINAEDMGILSYLKTHEPRLYATLVKAVCQNRRESK